MFPLLKRNKIWLGPGVPGGNAFFRIASESIREFASGVYDETTGLVKFRNVGWFTNIDHGGRHEALLLDTMEHNLKYNKKLKKKFETEYGVTEYPYYDNYDAIEVPFTECIPSDYDGVMGVPITFMDKYNPEQFEILGATQRGCHDALPDTKKYDDYWEVQQNGKRTGSSGNKTNENANIHCNDGRKNYFINADGDVIQSAYQRIFIRPKKGGSAQ